MTLTLSDISLTAAKEPNKQQTNNNTNTTNNNKTTVVWNLKSHFLLSISL